jgi:hypothetical protein
MQLVRKLSLDQGLGVIINEQCMSIWDKMRSHPERRQDGLVGLSYFDPKNIAAGHKTGYTVFAPAFLITRDGGYARRDYDSDAVPVDAGEINEFYNVIISTGPRPLADFCVLVKDQQKGWDGLAHNALAYWVEDKFGRKKGERINKKNPGAVGWSLQNNRGAGNYAMRFVSGANEHHFAPKPPEPPKPKPSFLSKAAHAITSPFKGEKEPLPTDVRDMPAHWTRWLCLQLAHHLGLKPRDENGKPYTHKENRADGKKSRVAFMSYYAG